MMLSLGYGRTGLFSIYSPRLRCCRSARAAALLRMTSRSLRQATYSGEPTATLLARQIASSSSPRLETGIWLRCAQAQSASATSISAMGSFAGSYSTVIAGQKREARLRAR
jgi:hypothetical protein